MNPKRVQREVRREMEKIKVTAKPSTFAQDYMREELEKKLSLTSNKKRKRKDKKGTNTYLFVFLLPISC